MSFFSCPHHHFFLDMASLYLFILLFLAVFPLFFFVTSSVLPFFSLGFSQIFLRRVFVFVYRPWKPTSCDYGCLVEDQERNCNRYMYVCQGEGLFWRDCSVECGCSCRIPSQQKVRNEKDWIHAEKRYKKRHVRFDWLWKPWRKELSFNINICPTKVCRWKKKKIFFLFPPWRQSNAD